MTTTNTDKETYIIYDRSYRFWTGSGFSKDAAKRKLFRTKDECYFEFNNHAQCWKFRGYKVV